MVRGAVLAHQSGAVQTDDDVQPQYGHVVDDVVVSALGKGTVDVAEGLQTVLGHAAGEGDGVPLGYAHVEGALRHCFHHDVH